jgi:hypothetical protein
VRKAQVLCNVGVDITPQGDRLGRGERAGGCHANKLACQVFPVTASSPLLAHRISEERRRPRTLLAPTTMSLAA